MLGRVILLDLSRRFVQTVGLIFFAIMSVAFLVDFALYAKRLGALPRYSFFKGLQLSALHMPGTVGALVPFAVLFASVVLLSRLAKNRELVVLRSSGVSAAQFISPLCAISLAVGAFWICAIDPLAARSIGWGRQLEDDIAGRDASAIRGDAPRWMAAPMNDDFVLIGAQREHNNGQNLLGVTFLRFNSGSLVERIVAKTAEAADGKLFLHDASRELLVKSRREDLARLTVQSPFTLAAFRDRFGDPGEVGFFDLQRAIKSAEQAGYAALPLKLRFFSLLCLPLMLVAMVLISAPISIRFERTGKSAMLIVTAVLVGYATYALNVLTGAMGSAGMVSPALAAAAPVAIAAGAGTFWILMSEDG